MPWSAKSGIYFYCWLGYSIHGDMGILINFKVIYIDFYQKVLMLMFFCSLDVGSFADVIYGFIFPYVR